tara:strand:- start:385 stop:636 length:252 start_codon:yes stop_codon:yes gene_type:complete
MFFEKWFDSGDLVIYEPEYNYMAYDDSERPYMIRSTEDSKIGLFLKYISVDSFDSCEVYIFSLNKIIVIPQTYLKLLSKNTQI